MSEFQWTSVNESLTQLEYIGHVENVIHGLVPEDLASRRFDARKVQYGFELASPYGIPSLGEAVLVNEHCYATSTDKTSSDYLKTIYGQTFITTGMMFVPQEAIPQYNVRMHTSTPMPLSELYSTLFERIKRPFAIAALIHFDVLSATCIQRPPIFHENIFKQSALYYPFDTETQENVWVFLVGVAADYSDATYSALLKELEVVLYNNPFEQNERLSTHTHGIVLSERVEAIKDITPQIVTDTRHIFSSQSRIKSAFVEVFVIDKLVEANAIEAMLTTSPS